MKGQLLLLSTLILACGCVESDPEVDIFPGTGSEQTQPDTGDGDKNDNVDTPKDDDVEVAKPSLHFDQFRYKYQFLFKQATIDTLSHEVLIYGVESGDDIQDVDYELNDSTIRISPDPKSLIGNWRESEELELVKGDDTTLYTVRLVDYVPVYEDAPHFTSFSFKVGDVMTYSDAEIDTAARTITIRNVEDSAQITGVKYLLNESDVEARPNPQTFVGQWKEHESVWLVQGDDSAKYTITLADYVEPIILVPSKATIYATNYFACKIAHHFIDIKGNAGAVSPANAKSLFVNGDLNGIRISIYGDAPHPAHPEPGVVVGSVYTKMINSINNGRAARATNPGDKDYIIFASKKLAGKESFPDWVMDANGVNPEKYTQLLVDYFKFMKSKGVEIDYLGIDNEENFNEGNITPDRHKAIVKLLRVELPKIGVKMPLILGPDRYNPVGNKSSSWMKQFYDKGYDEYLDVYGTHYYPHHHNTSMLNSLKYELNRSKGIPFWATEPHWDNANDKNGHDVMMLAHNAFSALWDQTDLGMDAFMWWGYSITGGGLRGNMMRAGSEPLRKSQPVRMVDHDGADIMPQHLVDSRAFRNGDMMHVYIMNMTGEANVAKLKPYEDYVFTLDGSRIDGDVICKQWSETGAVEGDKIAVTKINAKQFSIDMPVRTISYITFKVKDETPR